MTLEIRLHGRGGQGGVTCAKILAAIYARLGKSVQTFGDYAGERSGAPVRAYTRVSDEPISNRNKVYHPDHLLILDPTLLSDDVVSGLAPGGLLLMNTPEPPSAFTERFGGFKVATVDATSIARKHGIGTRSVVIVNTTIAGAYCKIVGLPYDALEFAYRDLHLHGNLPAAREAFDAVLVADTPTGQAARSASTAPPTEAASFKHGTPVMPLTEHKQSAPTGLKTGSWRTQLPRYVEHFAPCNAFCPAGNDVVTFVQTLMNEGEEAAAKVLGRTQPLASVCGRVCPAPCMVGCSRANYDGAVNIRALERWIGDRAPLVQKKELPPKEQRRIAIIGSGPAGLSAAYDLARGGHKVTIYEGEKELGGVLRTGIPTYRLPREVLDREIDAIMALGVEAHTGVFLDRDSILALGGQYDAVILAAGFGRPAKLDVPGVTLDGVEDGTRFLHRVNMEGGEAVSGHVVVLGGGNTAMDCARSALRSGANRVTVAYRRTRSEMPAILEEIEESEHEGVVFRFQRAPTAVHGNGRVNALELAEVEMGPPDESGRRRPVVSNRTALMECDHVLLALGQSADKGLLPADATITDGRVHRDGQPTNIYVSGDYATSEGTVAHAIGDGRRAAGRALASLGEEVKLFVRPNKVQAVPLESIRLEYFAPRPAAVERHEPVPTRIKTFNETNHGIPDPREAERCFSCGHCTRCDTCLVYCPEGIIDRVVARDGGGYDIDLEYCKGCGICVAECPRGAMEMFPQ
ncbi:MAG: FAD-dependent oxidoreductase [Candidatus Krumholzibacteria bacterium]|nr:FAD-dependent oxidoreductase [Candidatus Krumholzibacteria bacterium]MDH5627277.1 FAD-dependent oxidoreductase [Candidatus Krumholzibacteria bacterium]